MTKALFGVVVHSPSYVYDVLKKRSKVDIIDTATLESEEFESRYSKLNFLLFPSYLTFKKNIPNLEKIKGASIIFDTPLRLFEIDHIKILDAKKTLSWQFSLRKVDWEPLKEFMRNPPKKPVKIDIQKLDLLPKLIEKQREGKFLDKFNNLMYSNTNHITRDKLKLVILEWLFSSHTVSHLYKSLGKFPTRGNSKKALDEIVKFIENNPNFREACLKAISKKNANYKGLAKKYGVDPYEIKYLSKIRRSVKQLTRPTRTIKEVAGTIKHNIKQKKESSNES